jgi:lysophosphatidylcholine acyltransferase / lyso-PAF acetyltransferase
VRAEREQNRRGKNCRAWRACARGLCSTLKPPTLQKKKKNRLKALIPARYRAHVVPALGRLTCWGCMTGLGFTTQRWVPVDWEGRPRDPRQTRQPPRPGAPVSKGPPPPIGAYVANHLSYIDILALMAARFPAFVARGATAGLPLIGVISRAMGCLYVDRAKAAGAAGVASRVKERVAAQAAGKTGPEDRPLLLFPEGTTTNGRFLLPFRTGAFLAGAPVQPLILKFHTGPRSLNPSWETISARRHIFYLLAQPCHGLTVLELPVYVPTPEEAADPVLYAAGVRAAMMRAGDFSPLDATLEDKWEYQALLAGKPVPAREGAGKENGKAGGAVPVVAAAAGGKAAAAAAKKRA